MTGKGGPKKIRIDRYTLSFFLIIIIGAYMRFYHINKESIWLDEGYTIHISANIIDFLSSKEKLKTGYFETTPPLYFIVMHYWIKLFGTSEQSIRIPSAIAGIISLYLIYLLGKSLYDRKTGVIAALLLSISTYHVINVCQEARAYAFLNLFTLLSSYFLWKAMENGTIRNVILYTVFSILLIYTHYYSVFIILAQNIYILIILAFYRQSMKSDYLNWKRWIICLGAIFLSFYPWLGFLIGQVLARKGTLWYEVPSLADIYQSLLIFANLSLPILIMGCVLAVMAIRPVMMNRDKKKKSDRAILRNISWKDTLWENRQFILLSIWFLSVMFVPFFFSIVIFPFYNFRYVIPASLSFYILMACGITSIRNRYAVTIILIIIIALSIRSVIPFYRYPAKEQWKEAVSSIENAAEPGDLVLICHGILVKYCYNYYAKRRDLEVKPYPMRAVDLTGNYAIVDENDIPELIEAVENHKYVWLVLSHNQDPKGLMESTIKKNFKILALKNLYHIKIFLLEKK